MIDITLYRDAEICIYRLMLDDDMKIVVYLNGKVIRTVDDIDACDLDELIEFAKGK